MAGYCLSTPSFPPASVTSPLQEDRFYEENKEVLEERQEYSKREELRRSQ
jgi:hypothetical protein